MTVETLGRIRWATRGALWLGIVVSIAANVLHARSNPISQAIAAWPPLALFITVELIGRVPTHGKWLARARIATTAALSSIAAWVSYSHMYGVAARYGEAGAAPYLLPLSVDGLIVVASICLVELGRHVRAVEASDAAEAERVALAARLREIEASARREAEQARARRSEARSPRVVEANIEEVPPAAEAAPAPPRRGRPKASPEEAARIEAERLSALIEWRTKVGGKPNRDKVKALLSVSSATADRLLKRLAEIPIDADPEGYLPRTPSPAGEERA